VFVRDHPTALSVLLFIDAAPRQIGAGASVIVPRGARSTIPSFREFALAFRRAVSNQKLSAARRAMSRPLVLPKRTGAFEGVQTGRCK